VTVARAQFKIESERRAQLDFIGRPRSSRGMTLYRPDVTNLPGEDGMSCEIRARLTAAVLILGVVWAPAQTLAQQTFTPLPPPVPVLPSIIPQTQAFTTCVLNCDTASGSCQSACSVSNSPILTSAAGAHEALTQCYLSCTSQQLACKQACPAPQ
jgi:hypothetical protein